MRYSLIDSEASKARLNGRPQADARLEQLRCRISRDFATTDSEAVVEERFSATINTCSRDRPGCKIRGEKKDNPLRSAKRLGGVENLFFRPAELLPRPMQKMAGLVWFLVGSDVELAAHDVSWMSIQPMAGSGVSHVFGALGASPVLGSLVYYRVPTVTRTYEVSNVP